MGFRKRWNYLACPRLQEIIEKRHHHVGVVATESARHVEESSCTQRSAWAEVVLIAEDLERRRNGLQHVRGSIFQS